MIRVLVVRCCDAIARRLRSVADAVELRGDLVYRAHSRTEARKAARAEMTRLMRAERNTLQAIEDLIAETKPVRRVGSPINRDR